MPGVIAIVGRPNVGKSALFNRIAGRRIAIVHDQPGVTRDRVSAEVEWRGHPFTLVDTGGIGLLRGEKADDVITRAALEQVEIAIESAQLIILVVNVQEGVVPLDREAAVRLRQSGKPVLVAINKVDNPRLETAALEFAELGFDRLFPGRGGGHRSRTVVRAGGRGAAETGHRGPAERWEILNYQCADPLATGGGQPDSRHHARRGGCAVRG
jgi:small GTP-binding protein